MPTRQQWKFAEDRLASLFGTVRRPLSGSNSRSGGADDGQHPVLHIESKYSKSHALWTLYRKTKEIADKETQADGTKKKPVVIGLQEKSKPGVLLVIHERDFPAVILEYLWANGITLMKHHEENLLANKNHKSRREAMGAK